MEEGLTFADLDRLAAEREAKKRDLTDRLARILEGEFDFQELRFLFSLECEAVRTEAYEIARSKAKK